MDNSNLKIQKSVALPKEQWDKLAEIAKRKYMSVSDVIRQALAEYIKNNANK